MGKIIQGNGGSFDEDRPETPTIVRTDDDIVWSDTE